MGKRKYKIRLGSSAVAHADAAKNVARRLRQHLRSVRKAANGGQCGVALHSLVDAAKYEGSLLTHRGAGGGRLHFVQAGPAGRAHLVSALDRVESCYTKQKIKAVLKSKGSR